MTQDLLDKLESMIPVSVANRELLLEAFTHRSSVNEAPHGSSQHNERLEFLGDAVLDLVIADMLMRSSEKLDEGKMTQYKSAIVKGDALAQIALENCLDRHVILGVGEERSGGRTKTSNLAGLLEAIIGAVYLDSGLQTATKLVDQWFDSFIKITLLEASGTNPKGDLQHLCQINYNSLPDYSVISRHGPDHSPEFTVEVSINGKRIGEGKGSSLAEAERKAAQVGIVGFETKH
ncbi:ribonuclease III [Dehalococcoidia bacterium]|nr:ribonuclease III [Dehalococcoidia bacterium]